MTDGITPVDKADQQPARYVKHAGKPASGFAEALGTAARKGVSARATEVLPDKVDHTVAFEHRGCWYTEDTDGKISQTDAQSRSSGDVVGDRCGVFSDGHGGFVYRNLLGETAKAQSFDPAQAGFFKTADGAWAFRNSWGNVATSGATGKPLTPGAHAHIIGSV